MPAPELDCCTPVSAAVPSGRAWVHSRWCSNPALRNQKVRPRSDHPAGKNLPVADPPNALRPLPTWLLHPDGCTCPPCGYVDHWIDRDDDRTLEPTR